MIPQVALDEFVLVVADAFGAAVEGRVARGFLLLKDGLRSARESSAEWAPEAAVLWREALVAYQEQYPTEWYPPLD